MIANKSSISCAARLITNVPYLFSVGIFTHFDILAIHIFFDIFHFKFKKPNDMVMKRSFLFTILPII